MNALPSNPPTPLVTSDRLKPARRAVNIHTFAVVVVALIASLLGPLGTPMVMADVLQTMQVPAVRVQPELLAFAQTHPSASVDVIVQKNISARTTKTLEAWVAQHGGRVTANLSIINAFTARMPAASIGKLATQAQVRWVSHDGPMASTACAECVDTTALKNAYVRAVGADKIWNNASTGYDQGQDIGVAVLDSGIFGHADFQSTGAKTRVIDGAALNDGSNKTTSDQFGHGTFIAGVIGGNGKAGNNQYIGVAPRVNIINVKVSDDTNNGEGKASTVVAGLQWILENQARYNIRVVNISLNYNVAQPYYVDPLCAAVEVLWMNRIVVVVSAGNQGKGALYPPANDPFVITVGSADDKGTSSIQDDTLPAFSAYGLTIDGYSKPDLVAPGKNIIGPRTNGNSGMAKDHPGNIVDGHYFRLSGTSVSAPIVSAAAAMLLQSEPTLTPDQVKYRLKVTANRSWPAYDAARAGAGYLDVYAAITTRTYYNANTNLPISRILAASKPKPQLYRAINVNGPAVTIDGQVWEGDSAQSYAAGPSRFCNTNVPLTVPTDAARMQMIRCSVRSGGWGSSKSPYITLGTVPNGSYQVYIHVWEDDSPETFALLINGSTVRTNLNTGQAGAWARLGPFAVAVTNGQIALTTSGGKPNLSGIEVYVASPPKIASAQATAATDSGQPDDGHQGITMLPSPQTPPATDVPTTFKVHLPIVMLNASGTPALADQTTAPAVVINAEASTEASPTSAQINASAATTGVLNGSLDWPSSSVVDLTAEGVLDWVNWGRTSATSEDRKLGGGKQIGSWTTVGDPTNFDNGDSNVGLQWTDGASVTSAISSNKVECQCGQGEGFRIKVPADTNQRVLKVYVSLRGAAGRLVARLSDGSAAKFEDASFISKNWFDEPIRVYTLVYRAASSGQTLTVEWTRDPYAQWNNRVSLLAATLAPDPATALDTWDSSTWGSVSWSSVSWSSVSWSSVSWSSDFWKDDEQQQQQ